MKFKRETYFLIGKGYEKDCTENEPWGKKRNLRGRDKGILSKHSGNMSQSRKAQGMFREQEEFNVVEI